MLKFAIEMEEEIIRQIENLGKNVCPETEEFFGILLKIEKDFLGLLKEAVKINADLENYPQVDARKILGENNQLPQSIAGENRDMCRIFCTLWMVYALLEKSAQYYKQASLNSPHPALKLFMGSLGEVKNIFRSRTAAYIRMTHNDVWEKIGFAPFVLGKD